MKDMPVELAKYIADYVNEELSRRKKVTTDTIVEAVDAFNGGSR